MDCLLNGKQAVITLGALAIRADSILIAPNQLSIRARGLVLVGDSTPERRGSSASVDLARPVALETVVVEP